MSNDNDAVLPSSPLAGHLAARGTGSSSDPSSAPLAGERLPGHTEQPERVLRSVDLMAGAREVRIEHSGELYRLRVTRQGKLILYK